MLIQNNLFLIPVCSGVVFILAGWVMLKFPSKKINSLYGYRTINSMKSQEHWDFAQNYSSKEMRRLGSLLLLSGLIGLVYQPSENIATIMGLGLLIFMVIMLMYRVEKAIKRKIDAD